MSPRTDRGTGRRQKRGDAEQRPPERGDGGRADHEFGGRPHADVAGADADTDADTDTDADADVAGAQADDVADVGTEDVTDVGGSDEVIGEDRGHDADPGAETAAEDDTADANDGDASGRRMPATRRATVLAVLAAVTVVAAASAVWLGVRAGGAVPGDVAHVDQARTQQVSEEIGEAVTAVLSYDRGDLARTERAAHRVLTGAAREEYAATFDRLRGQDGGGQDGGGQAGGSGTVQSTTVRSTGVQSLEGERAELLVLADRRVLGEDMRSRGSNAVWIDVVAVHTDGGWRIAEMSPV